MRRFLRTSLGRLRVLAFLEGSSLLLLVFVGVPLKYLLALPAFVRILGPIHGALFLLYVLNVVSVGVQQQWRWRNITWKLILASFIPLGTFFIDHKLLRPLHAQESIS